MLPVRFNKLKPNSLERIRSLWQDNLHFKARQRIAERVVQPILEKSGQMGEVAPEVQETISRIHDQFSVMNMLPARKVQYTPSEEKRLLQALDNIKSAIISGADGCNKRAEEKIHYYYILACLDGKNEEALAGMNEIIKDIETSFRSIHPSDRDLTSEKSPREYLYLRTGNYWKFQDEWMSEKAEYISMVAEILVKMRRIEDASAMIHYFRNNTDQKNMSQIVPAIVMLGQVDPIMALDHALRLGDPGADAEVLINLGELRGAELQLKHFSYSKTFGSRYRFPQIKNKAGVYSAVDNGPLVSSVDRIIALLKKGEKPAADSAIAKYLGRKEGCDYEYSFSSFKLYKANDRRALLAIAFAKAGLMELAIEYTKKTSGPVRTGALVACSVAHTKRGEYKEAISALNKAVGLANEDMRMEHWVRIARAYEYVEYRLIRTEKIIKDLYSRSEKVREAAMDEYFKNEIRDARALEPLKKAAEQETDHAKKIKIFLAIAALEPEYADIKMAEYLAGNRELVKRELIALYSMMMIGNNMSPRVRSIIKTIEKELAEEEKQEMIKAQVREEEEDLARDEMLFDIIRNLSLENKSLWKYVESDRSDELVEDALAKIILENEMVDKTLKIIEKLAQQNPELADETLMWLLAKRYEDFERYVYKIERIASRYSLKATAEICEEVRAFDEVNNYYPDVEQVIETIAKNILEKLGMQDKISGRDRAGSGGGYGSISYGGGLSLSLRIEPRLSLRLDPAMLNEIEIGRAFETEEERLIALNFLVHHEVAHMIQDRFRYRHPIILGYEHIDQADAEHHANEVLVDALGYDAARKVYVYRHPDMTLLEYINGGGVDLSSEAIATEAFYALGINVFRNIKEGNHDANDAFICRLAAVSYEIAMASEEIKNELLALADSFKRLTIDKKNRDKNEEVERLISEYREIFRQTKL